MASLLSKKLIDDVARYIEEHFVEESAMAEHSIQGHTVAEHSIQERTTAPRRRDSRRLRKAKEITCEPMMDLALAGSTPLPLESSLEDYVGRLDEPFSTMLLRLIDAKGKQDVEVYKRANLDRKLFSKIRTGRGYIPSKRTVLALAIALELNLSETDDFLERAGFALSPSQLSDVIVEFFIVNGKYNIFEINEVLFKYDQPLLGS